MKPGEPAEERWQQRGRCGGATKAFFDDAWHGDASSAGDEWRQRPGPGLELARATCAGCPVKEECLEYALVNNERWGVWGGTTPPERAAMRKARKLAG